MTKLHSLRRTYAVPLVAVILIACPSGYSFEVGPDARLVVDRSLIDAIRDTTAEAVRRWPTELVPLIHADTNPDLARRSFPDGTPVLAEACRRLSPLLSIAHLSDVQLKEHDVSLDGPGPFGEKLYDVVSDGAVRPDDIELYDHAVFLATVLGINNVVATQNAGHDDYGPCPAPLEPSLVIHTGDAIDASVFSELFEFIGVISQLTVPFYNVIGNHDVMFFGTFPTEVMEGVNIVLPYVPVSGARRFMLAHSWEAAFEDISIPHLDRDEHIPTTRGQRGRTITSISRSSHHGFDLRCSRRVLCDTAGGYYVVNIETQRDEDARVVHVKLIALNTSEILPKDVNEALQIRSRGNMDPEQFAWLEEQIGDNLSADVVFVMGHHPFDRFVGNQGDQLRERLAGQPRVAAYLTGHTHVNAVEAHPRPGGGTLWEIVGGSLTAFPQVGQIVELLENTSDTTEYFLRVRSFRQQLSDLACPDAGAANHLACLAKRAREAAEGDNTKTWRTEQQVVNAVNWMLPVKVAN